MPCSFCLHVTPVGDPGRGTNITRTDVTHLKGELPWQELEGQDEAEGHNKENAEQKDPEGPPRGERLGWLASGEPVLARIKRHVVSVAQTQRKQGSAD
jgi:hypothetical protein